MVFYRAIEFTCYTRTSPLFKRCGATSHRFPRPSLDSVSCYYSEFRTLGTLIFALVVKGHLKVAPQGWALPFFVCRKWHEKSRKKRCFSCWWLCSSNTHVSTILSKYKREKITSIYALSCWLGQWHFVLRIHQQVSNHQNTDLARSMMKKSINMRSM